MDRPRACRHYADDNDISIAAILRSVRLDHPGIDLVVTNAPTPNSVENIIQNRIDLGLVNLPVQKKKQLKITQLCPEVLVAIFPAGTRDIPDEITPGYVARQNLLVEQASSAAHSLVLGVGYPGMRRRRERRRPSGRSKR